MKASSFYLFSSMCGIAGYFTVNPSPSPPTLLDRMTQAIQHRGPDAHGVFHDGHAHLGHRRLSIVDLSEAGRQPMANEDGRVQIVYNGEIFNHAAIRPELEAAGHRYRGHSDTETIIHGWEQWGPRVIDRFRGMFAFALWDVGRRSGIVNWIDPSTPLPARSAAFLTNGGELESRYPENFYSGFSGAERKRLFRLPQQFPLLRLHAALERRRFPPASTITARHGLKTQPDLPSATLRTLLPSTRQRLQTSLLHVTFYAIWNENCING